MAGRRARRILLWLAGVVVLGLVVIGLLAALQRQLIYFPDKSAVPPANEVIPGAEDVTLRTEDGLELGAWFVPPQGRDRQLAVLMAPGNGGNRAGRADLARALAERGFAVLVLDYRGYGGNPGSPTEEGLALDAAAALDASGERGYEQQQTIYFGESLGTGVVAGLAAQHPPAGIVLRSPFPELADVGAHHYPWLPVRTILRDRFPVVDNLRKLEGSQVPITVVYGDSDSVVPTELSREVAQKAPAPVDEVVFRGADHNDPVMFGDRVAQAVARLADRIGTE